MSASKAATEAATEKTVKVTAKHPFQVGYQGAIAGPGESIEVPESLAHQWAGAGFITD